MLPVIRTSLGANADTSLSEPILPKWEVSVSQEDGFEPVEDLSAFMSMELAKSRTDQRDIQVRMGRTPPLGRQSLGSSV